MSKIKLTTLRTVYPPISNADAVRLMRDPAVEALLRTSDFYMIGGRAQAHIIDPVINQDTNEMTFNFVVGDKKPSTVRIALRELPGVVQLNGKEVLVEIDQAGSGFRIWDGPALAEGSDVVEWFTTEKLLWDRARGRAGIYGLDHVRELATYDLLYVGIAKKGDSFDRLLARGHKARQEILANEPQRYPGARVSDETFLFLSKADPLIFQTFEPDHEFSDADLDVRYDIKRIVADAEKAFVSLLLPEYNVEKFASYPKGKDGLYGSDYARYGYVIGEQMGFNTAHGTIRGGVRHDGMFSNDADVILVEGDTVRLYRAGIDFPTEDEQAAESADE
jgi:hypothetical protein